jgi:hypothetical protein
MKTLILGLSFFVSGNSFAEQGLNCSKCGGYGSPFGPGYSYACYFVTDSQKVAQAYRFDDVDTCIEHQRQNPACAAPILMNTETQDPCWKL